MWWAGAIWEHKFWWRWWWPKFVEFFNCCKSARSPDIFGSTSWAFASSPTSSDFSQRDKLGIKRWWPRRLITRFLSFHCATPREPAIGSISSWRSRNASRVRAPTALVAQRVRAPSPLVTQRDSSPATGQKRRGASEPEDSGKSKNSRHNPRGSAGAALTSLANAYTQHQTLNAGEPTMMQVMMMQMQMQQQSQESSRVQQNQRFQMLMMMMAPRDRRGHSYRNLADVFASSITFSSSNSSSSFNSNRTEIQAGTHNEKGDYWITIINACDDKSLLTLSY